MNQMWKKQNKWIVCLLVFINGLSNWTVLAAQEVDSVWNIRKVEINGYPESSDIHRLKNDCKEIQNETQLDSLINVFLKDLSNKGWQEASLPSYEIRGKKLILNWDSGPKYVLSHVHVKDYAPIYQDESPIDLNPKKEYPLNWPGLENKLNQQLRSRRDEGYPFAHFTLEDIQYELNRENQIETSIFYQYQAGNFVTIDSIFIEGKPKEHASFIHSLIRIYPKAAYNHSLIQEIPRILNNSIYYQNVKDPQLTFVEKDKAHLTIELEPTKAGKFDVLLGFLQSDASAAELGGNSRRLQVIGSAEVLLVSSLKRGDILQFSYQSLTANSQQLNIFMQWPYLLKTPLYAEASFDIRNQQEQFLVREFRVGGKYAFSQNLAATFYYRDRASRLLDSAFTQTQAQGETDLVGGQLSLAGIGLTYNSLDYPLNPTKGISFLLEAGAGSRETRRNSLVDVAVFDTLTQSQPSREVRAHVKWFRSLSQRQVIHLGHESLWLGQENYFQNDQWQLGGARSIRGFNENQFFADLMLKFTAEYRFLLERNSYLSLFGDYAYLRDNVLDQVLHPRGVGIGMHYGTKAGIISISYAAGKVGDTPFEAGRGKIHIGYVNQF